MVIEEELLVKVYVTLITQTPTGWGGRRMQEKKKVP